MKRINKRQEGIALLLVVGILTIFTVTLTTFALNMQLERTASNNYSNSVKARYLAEAGVDYAQAIIRNNFKSTPIDSLSERWASPYTLNFPNYGSIQLSLQDEQARVNINNASLLLLGNLPSVGPALAQNIINYRNYFRQFSTKGEVRLVAGIGEATYNAIKDFITVGSYINPSRENRSPINMNTADSVVITAVLNGISDGSNTITSVEAQNLTNELISARPFDSWAEFNNVIDNSASINSAKKIMLKTLLNPYSRWPSTAPSNFTTEFCLFSGCFSVVSNSTILNRAGNPSANARTEAVISLFSNINDAVFITTLKEDFRGEDADYDGSLDTGEDVNGNGNLDVPTYARVTWMDSCPVNSNDDLGLTYRHDLATYPDYGYQVVKDSLKIGFWDNFDEDENYTRSEWIREQGSYSIVHSSHTDPIKNTSDKQLVTTAPYSVLVLFDSSKWAFGDSFSIRIFNFDSVGPPAGAGCEDIGNVEFHGTAGGIHKFFINRFEYLYWGGPQDISGDGFLTYPEDCMDVMFKCALWSFNNTGYSKYVTPNYDIFPEQKTYRFVSTGVNQQPSCYISYDTSGYTPISSPWQNNRYNYPFFSPDPGPGWQFSSWRLKLTTLNQVPVWDDVRIISSSGSYTSIPFDAGRQVEWGTVSGTVTIVPTASPVNETVSFQTSTDGGITFLSPQAGGAISQSPSQTIQHRAILSTNDPDLSQTPVLEDATITFLKPNTVKTIYYKQVSE
ncbi:MAG: general secretion pathway protein GspK [Candidatus Omnitrophica bacterium]|nr:general secretion pathway protein GspK [Candidatus Omnitrophota bacterium]